MKRMLALVLALVAATGCHHRARHNLPPAAQLMHPGPGVDGPGPGVMMMGGGPGGGPGGGGGGMAGCAPGCGPDGGMGGAGATSQLEFVGPEGVVVAWDVGAPGQFDSEPLVCPGRYNFPQGALYRLKLTNVPGRAGMELYPTIEVAPTLPRTEAYLAHNSIPVQWTEEDFDQVQTGNFVTKVIYLPDAEFQDLAIAGVDTLVSTRLDPGVDPIVEADRRGAILAIVRMGNKDLQVPGSLPQPGGVEQVGYNQAMAPSFPSNVSGVTSPQWGLPTCGTPIGLPGPPHIPLGGPAGLQKHQIINRTHVHIPHPTRKLQMIVKQKPGISYPRPANTVHIVEKNGMARRWGAGLRAADDAAGSYGGGGDGSGADCQ